MQHHQIDEFSVTDVRHTINEVWRVISARRWFLVFPFLAVSAAACVASLLYPRAYTASTTLKREHDPVFAHVIGAKLLKPYEDIRKQAGTDINNPDFLESVLAEHDLPANLGRFEDGSLTPAGEAARKELTAELSEGLVVSTTEASKHRDVVQIDLTLDDPIAAAMYLRLIRDAYIPRAREQTVGVLEDVEAFLAMEAQRCQDELGTLSKRLVEYELKYPGIDPNRPDPANAEQTALVIERVGVERRRDTLAIEIEQLRTQLATLTGPADEPDGGNALAFLDEPNPRYAELVAEIEQLQEKITDGRTTRSMTEAHPDIKRSRSLLAARQAELTQTPPTLRIPGDRVLDNPKRLASIRKLEAELSQSMVSLEGISARLRTIDARTQELRQCRALAIEHREDYTKLQSESKTLTEEAGNWQQSITPIRNVLHLEGSDRSIHFATVRDVPSIVQASSPDASLVMLICLGLGLAAAMISVLMAELIDRSYRTVKQLSASLGLPVIESIDEILTQAAHRRRVLRRLVVLPTLAIAMVAALALAGSTAYFSLERPHDTRATVASPAATCEMIAGDGGMAETQLRTD